MSCAKTVCRTRSLCSTGAPRYQYSSAPRRQLRYRRAPARCPLYLASVARTSSHLGSRLRQSCARVQRRAPSVRDESKRPPQSSSTIASPWQPRARAMRAPSARNCSGMPCKRARCADGAPPASRAARERVTESAAARAGPRRPDVRIDREACTPCRRSGRSRDAAGPRELAGWEKGVMEERRQRRPAGEDRNRRAWSPAAGRGRCVHRAGALGLARQRRSSQRRRTAGRAAPRS